MTADERPAEMDDYARELYEDYRRAAEAAAEFEAHKVKARDQLIAWFRLSGANVGTVDGEPRVSLVESAPMVLDAKRLHEDERAIWEAYARPVPRAYLRLRG